MLNNYQYFIALAEELNISRAAEKLFISHQCLSKYLKNLESEYGVPLFERTPRMKLTLAGEALLAMFRKVEFLELNLQSQLEDIRNSKRGIIRLGTTEGRYRILIPELLAQYRKLYPEVDLDVRYATSAELAEGIRRTELDIVILNKTFVDPAEFEIRPLIDEKLYLIVSDNMLAHYFPEQYPECKARFRKDGVDLAEFQELPFVLNTRKFKSRMLIDAYALTHGLTLKCVRELTQLDVHFQLTAHDYAASFCWTMYLPTV
ncbi:MAG: LysR family transcriptional regulator, partial [Pyramidobacter sp.]|nr:LysR family transcriptional regulator [Pyramidobacter sp.]